jgi:hypothetical protein
MQTDWEIQRRGSACGRCNTPFADKSAYHTVLQFDAGGYSRRDLCPNCWTQEKAASTGGAVSVWQGIYKSPPPEAPEPIEKNTAEKKLRELLGSAEPSHAAVRYILAVMLERKKILRLRDTLRQDDKDIIVYEHAETGETFTITDPHLRLDQLEQVQQDVTALLAAA